MSYLLGWLWDMALKNRIAHVHGGLLDRGSRGVTIVVDPGRKRGGSNYPYKIYPATSGTPDEETDWRKIIVRTGRVGTVVATKTDGVSDPYSGESMVAPESIITCDEDEEEFKVWIELTAGPSGQITSAEIKSGAGGWTGYPTAVDSENGKGFILIGTVDTATELENKGITIKQSIREDFPPLRIVQLCIGEYCIIPCWI